MIILTYLIYYVSWIYVRTMIDSAIVRMMFDLAVGVVSIFTWKFFIENML